MSNSVWILDAETLLSKLQWLSKTKNKTPHLFVYRPVNTTSYDKTLKQNRCHITKDTSNVLEGASRATACKENKNSPRNEDEIVSQCGHNFAFTEPSKCSFQIIFSAKFTRKPRLHVLDPVFLARVQTY